MKSDLLCVHRPIVKTGKDERMKTTKKDIRFGVLMGGLSGAASLIVFTIACFKHSIELFLIAIYLAQWESGSTVIRNIDEEY